MHRKKTALVVGVIVLVLLLLCGHFVVTALMKQDDDSVERFAQAAPRPDILAPAAEPAPTPGTPEPTPEAPYVSPVDFTALQQTNPDIYAWLDIPGTDISYPLLQNTDDTYYLTHDAERNENRNGALFSESAYNGTTFSDPVTLIYGHNMRNDLMFSKLQQYYSDAAEFSRCHEIIVYLPDRELHFEVFAAVPYDCRHLLYNYDFTDERIYRLVFEDILSIRSLEANFAAATQVLYGDQVLILSTCLNGRRSNRFLVCAKLQ